MEFLQRVRRRRFYGMLVMALGQAASAAGGRYELEWVHAANELYRALVEFDSERAKDFREAHGKLVPLNCMAGFDTVTSSIQCIGCSRQSGYLQVVEKAV